jgi:hypothetical protein
VRTDPKLRAMAEKEERQRQRNERKLRKGGVSDRPVTLLHRQVAPKRALKGLNYLVQLLRFSEARAY